MDKDTEMWAWAAGIIEGEGYISQHGITVQMTDKDVLDRLSQIFPGGSLTPYPRRGPAHWKDTWRWSLYKQALVLPALEKLRPWFLQRRKAKANEVIALLERKRDYCRTGHLYAGNTYLYKGSRHCKVCRRDAAKRAEAKRPDRKAEYRKRYLAKTAAKNKQKEPYG